MNPSVLLVGMGKLGGSLAQQLSLQGWQVTGLCRTPRLHSPYPLHYVDLCQQVPTLPAYDYVVVMLTPASRDEAGYRATFVHGLQHLLQGLSQPPQRLLFVSSTSVYHQSEGEWVDEQSPTQPSGYAGQVLLQAEDLVRALPYPTSVLRLSGIYGAGRNHLLEQVLAGVGQAEQPAYISNRIHQQDVVGFICHLLNLALQQQPWRSCYLVTDSEPAPLAEVCQWLAQQLGVQLHTLKGLRSRGGSKYCRNHAVIESGYVLHYPDYRQGYQATLVELGYIK